jgi:hypothetical protein
MVGDGGKSMSSAHQGHKKGNLDKLQTYEPLLYESYSHPFHKTTSLSYLNGTDF